MAIVRSGDACDGSTLENATLPTGAGFRFDTNTTSQPRLQSVCSRVDQMVLELAVAPSLISPVLPPGFTSAIASYSLYIPSAGFAVSEQARLSTTVSRECVSGNTPFRLVAICNLCGILAHSARPVYMTHCVEPCTCIHAMIECHRDVCIQPNINLPPGVIFMETMTP